jgi:hypothetical protein
MGLLDDRFTAAGAVAGSSFALPAHRRRLPTVEGRPRPNRLCVPRISSAALTCKVAFSLVRP